MKATGILLLSLLPLTGCGDVNHTVSDYSQSSNKLATAGDDEVLRLAPVVVGGMASLASPPAPSAPPGAAGVVLRPDSASQLRGSGRLTSSASGALVAVGLAGGSSSTTYQGAVRQGSCTAIGSVVAPLVPVTTDSAGEGRSASRIGVPLDSLLSAPHVLVFGPGGRPESCGPVAAAPLPPPPGATGEPDTVPRDPSAVRTPAPPTPPRDP